MRIKAFLIYAALGCATMLGAAGAMAQAYPTKSIRVIVPNPPGGSTDIVARQLANGLTAELGQPVVIDNRGGASGMVGAQVAAAAPADGYSLFLATTSVMAINPVSFTKVPYDPIESFAPISLLTSQPLAFVVRAAHPAKTLNELMAIAKAKPGVLNFASTGASGALPFYYLQHLAGVTTTAIPYAGAGPGLNALLGGQVDVLPISLGTVYPHVQAGKVRILAATSLQRSTLVPDVPTVTELGYTGFQASIWNGLVAPAGTPREIIARLNRAVVKVMSTPEMQAHFSKDGTQVMPTTPEKFGEHVRGELERWKKVAKDSNLPQVTP